MKEKKALVTPKDNFYLFKSCTTGSLYPGIETSVKYVLDMIGTNYTDDPDQSSCGGFAIFSGMMPFETGLALNARNLSLAASTDTPNVLCICPACYSNLKNCKKLLGKDEELEARTRGVLRQIGRDYDVSPNVSQASDVMLARIKDLKAKALYSLSGIRAVTHHGCHYTNIFFDEVTSGTFERPTVLDDILGGFGCEVQDYTERTLCCGMGFHHLLADDGYQAPILQRKYASIAEAEPDVIVTQCASCTFTLDHYRRSSCEGSLKAVPVLDISELLALLLGADPLDIGLDMHTVPVEPLLEKIGIGRAGI
jgi:heterodisulfide reductase subunit B1